MSPLGLLNFLVLQWFGVRLARCMRIQGGYDFEVCNPLDHRVTAERIPVGWTWLRWVWPLTGWWSDYRFIVRRP